MLTEVSSSFGRFSEAADARLPQPAPRDASPALAAASHRRVGLDALDIRTGAGEEEEEVFTARKK